MTDDEIVEVVRTAFERFPDDEWLDLLDPEIEWHVRPDLPDADVYRGHEGVREVFGRFEEVLEDQWAEPLEFIRVGDEMVVVPLHWGGTGRGSGIEIAERGGETWVLTVRGGKIVRVREFTSREAALEASGGT